MVKPLVAKLATTARALAFSGKYRIGPLCRFERISLSHCPRGSVQMGRRVVILRRTEIRALVGAPVSIGDGTFINTDCLIRPNVSIGKNVAIGPRTSIISDNHEVGSSLKRAGGGSFDPIEIGDGCWIGACCTILGGVRIGAGSVVGAGAVVVSDCEPDALYCGIPARLVRKLPHDGDRNS